MRSILASFDDALRTKIIDNKNSHGNTPLRKLQFHIFKFNFFEDWATLNRQKESIEVLLEYNANPEIENKEGDRPIDIAVKFNLEKILVNYSPLGYV